LGGEKKKKWPFEIGECARTNKETNDQFLHAHAIYLELSFLGQRVSRDRAFARLKA
jgi:hypothetical protein